MAFSIGPLLVLFCLTTAAWTAEQDRSGIQVRLLTPLASYSAPGTSFEAKVIGSVDPKQRPALPVGSRIRGTVAAARSIGFGVRTERASLELAFDSCTLPDGQAVACDAVLTEVDNARETVTRDGRIQGILAASHPHSWLSGVWFHPGAAISGRSASGLTGAGGSLQSAVAPSPIGAVIIVASRLFLFRLPDPEIELPAGTDLHLEITSELEADFDMPEEAPAPPVLRVELQEWLAKAPAEVMLADGRPAADIVNFALVGSKQQVAAAFQAAGWAEADPLTPKTFARSYAAAAQMRTYRTAPVSPLRYQGRLPDLVFQKSLNSLAKRHHIRLWATETNDGTVWLGAATHDVGVAFDWSRMSLTHRIDLSIDAERQKVAYDLSESGCVAGLGMVARPEQARETSTDGSATTDGALMVGRMRDCSRRTPVRVARTKRPKRAITTVLARRFILEGRHYVTRGNAYYWAYRGFRWMVLPSRETQVARQTPKVSESVPKSVKEVLNDSLDSTALPFEARPRS